MGGTTLFFCHRCPLATCATKASRQSGLGCESARRPSLLLQSGHPLPRLPPCLGLPSCWEERVRVCLQQQQQKQQQQQRLLAPTEATVAFQGHPPCQKRDEGR